MALLASLLANAEALALLATAAALATTDGSAILGAALFGSLCAAAIRPTYGDASDVYATVGFIVCAVGAVTGGSVAVLAPAKVTAVSAAGLVALPLALLLEHHNRCPDSGVAPDASGNVFGAFVATLIAGGALYSAERDAKRDMLVKRVAHALAAGWFAALALDKALAGGSALWVHVVAVARPGDVPGPEFIHYAFGELWACVAWLVIAISVFVVRPQEPSGSLRAAAMPSRDVRRDDGRASDAATHQLHLVSARTQYYNLFDPLKLPPALKRFATQTFASAEALGNFFGLQDDNVRSQAEHALMLFANALARQPPGRPSCDAADELAARSVHAKLFENYRQWCSSLEVEPHFSPKAEDTGGAYGDVVLWLCVWGECANLRHLPECVCYLYHSCAGEWAACEVHERQGDRGASLYPGHFLDTVVSPIYDVIAQQMRLNADHIHKKNYDDCNEFFWSKHCLKYHRSPVATETAVRAHKRRSDVARQKRASQSMSGETSSLSDDVSTFPPPVHLALSKAPKTYMEERTWLHVAFAFGRVYEYHALWFQVLATFAFSTYLVWDFAYALQVYSGLFIAINLYALLNACLEAKLQGTACNDVAKGALAARVCGRYACFVYQCMYLSWAFDINEVLPRSPVRSLGKQPAFWFWQYVWLSLLPMCIYVTEAALQLWPRALTTIYTSGANNDVARALLAVFLPRSTNYVGKSVHEPLDTARTYQLYWLILVLWKLAFGYQFLVKPMVSPTIQIVDDYLNYPQISGRGLKTASQLVGRWAPPCLIFLIDSSIWYSLASSAVGVYVGFRDKLGIVRDFPALRDAFLLLPTNFCAKLVHGVAEETKGQPLTTPASPSPGGLRFAPGSDPRVREASSCLYQTVCGDEETRNPIRRLGDATPPTSSSDLASTLGAASSYNGALAPRLPSFLSMADALDTPADGARRGLLDLLEHGSAQKHLEPLGAADEVQWVLFAEAWNDVISAMRSSDIITNYEREVLQFDRFPGFSKPVYLPIFVTAGAVERAVSMVSDAAAAYRPLQKLATSLEDDVRARSHAAAARAVDDDLAAALQGDVVATEAVDEVKELATVLLLKLLGPIHKDDVIAIISIIEKWARGPEALLQHVRVEDLAQKVLKPLAELAGLLESKLHKRQVSTDAPLDAYANLESTQPSEDASEADGPTGSLDSLSSLPRSQSTSGLAALGRASLAPTSSAPLRPLKTQKYSLGSQKYMAGSQKEARDPLRDALRDKLRSALAGAKACVVKNATKGSYAREVLDRLTFVLANERGFFWDGRYASACADSLALDAKLLKRLAVKLKGLLTTPQRKTEPRGQEATRRLTFFVNSLLMDLPPPPPLDAAVSLTTLTPFYSEDVILSESDLRKKNSDGVTTLLYLQTLYKADWRAFLERRGIDDHAARDAVFSEKHVVETRLWASYRAQTLARTVEGIMQNEAALRLLARLERVNDARRSRRRAGAPKTSRLYAAACDESPTHPQIALEDLLKLKFGYVVTCQIYGRQSAQQDPKAKDIEMLLKRNPLLRVAYIDEQRVNRSGASAFYSCLVKYDALTDGPAEVYRVRLPGNAIVGEGKPENQNHAVVFTRGETLQTIDMNQAGYFEEALKTRNLVQEFRGERAPGAPPIVIVGFREHIFTGSVSSLANYMALQELSFVTLGQRVLADPLHMRLHYGHPDIFDKLWFTTRGGVSKASRGINLSEDIFAGYTAVIRGGGVTMREYAQVGKGRDVGMQQIYKFEAKLSQGNAEQCLARDVSRVAARLDFPRLLSYYFGGIGHYINSALTVLTIQVATYLSLLLAVYGAESIGHRLVVPLGTLQVVLAGLGLLNTLPLLATLAVERGLLNATRDVAQVFASGGPLYFVFHIQTRAHYFTQTLLAGGATYRATGRGFVTTHNSFDEQYRFFAASHLYLGVELAAALGLMGAHTMSDQYLGRTWSLWLACGAFLLAPFWFNPLGFSWPHVAEDFVAWRRWISYGTRGGSATDSWEVWHKEETAPLRRLSHSSKCVVSLKALLYVVLAKGLFDFTGKAAKRSFYDFSYFLLVLVLLQACAAIVDRVAHRLHYACHRLVQMVLGICSVGVTVFEVCAHPASLKFAVSMYYLAAAVCVLGTLWGGEGPAVYGGRRHSSFASIVPSLTRHLARLHDLAVGYMYFAVFAPLSAIRVVDVVQTWLLFHNALSEGVVVDDILKQARQSQETASSNGQSEEIAQLRRQVELQQQALGALLEGRGDASAYYQAAAAPPPRSPSDSAVDVRRNSVPATTGRFSFTQPAQPPPRDTMSEPATDGLA